MVTVLIERWQPKALACIHRAEAAAIATELRAAGEAVRIARWQNASRHPDSRLLLRVSDPAMLPAARALSIAGLAYCGPGVEALARCYDKGRAYAIAGAHGIECPATWPADAAPAALRPLIVKPREGSDSIGLRLVAGGTIPARCRNADHLAQTFVRGTELTIAVLGSETGMPLRIEVPPDQPYTFWRKYVWPPRRTPLADTRFAEQVRAHARVIAQLFGIEWAARVDLIHERGSGRLVFLECDAAPLVGPDSAFAASLAAAGMARAAQLERLLALGTAPAT